jgi:hypothetical protein
LFCVTPLFLLSILHFWNAFQLYTSRALVSSGVANYTHKGVLL